MLQSELSFFLSYHPSDREFAVKLAEQLRNSNVRVWMDLFDAGPDDNYPATCSEALTTCRGTILVISEHYVAEDYCCAELETVVRLSREEEAKGRASRIVIPVLISPSSVPSVLQGLRNIGSFDFKEWQNESAFLARVSKLTGQISKESAVRKTSAPNEQARYLNTLIAQLESCKGVLEYVELSASELPTHVPNMEPSYKRPSPWAQTTETIPDLLICDNVSAAQQALKQVLEAGTSGTHSNRSIESISAAIPLFSKFVVIGGPGSGKTTAIRRLAVDLARKQFRQSTQAKIPVFLDLSDWESNQTPADFVKSRGPFLDNNLDLLLANGQLFLFWDGLNEMGSEGRERAQVLKAWIHSKQLASTHMIITCRHDDYTNELDLGLPVIVIKDLDEPKIRLFADRYLKGKADLFLQRIFPEDHEKQRQTSHLRQFARNPFLLRSLILVFANIAEGKMPDNNGVLFRALVAEIWKREETRQPSGWIPLEKLEHALGYLAYNMIDAHQPVSVPYHWAHRQLVQPLSKFGLLDQLLGVNNRSTQLINVSKSAGLLDVHVDRLRFSHQLIQEYFAATWLKKHGVIDKISVPYFVMHYGRRADKWDQVIIAACGLLDSHEASQAMDQLLSKDIYLAACCVASNVEISEAKLAQLVTYCIRGLSSPQLHISNNAESALLRLGQRIIPHLLAALKDPDQIAKGIAPPIVNILIQIGSANIPTFIDEFENTQDDHLRFRMAQVLDKLGVQSVNGLDDVLRNPNQYTVHAPVLMAVPVEPRPESQPHSDGSARRDLAEDGANLEILFDRFANDSPQIRKFFIEWLGKSQNTSSIKLVESALRDEDIQVRYQAAIALGKIGQRSSTFALIETARDNTSRYADSELRQHALRALIEIDDPNVVDQIAPLIDDDDREVRHATLDVLGYFGDARATSAYVKALSDPEDRSIRDHARDILLTIGVTPALVYALRNPSGDARFEIAQILDELEWSAETPLQLLDYAIAIQDWDQCAAVGPDGFPRLIELLQDHDPEVRFEAARILEQLEWQAETPAQQINYAVALKDWDQCVAVGLDGFPRLIELLQHDEQEIVIFAMHCLVEIDRQRALEPLLSLLRHRANEVRLAATTLIGDQQYEDAVPALVAQLDIELNNAVVTAGIQALCQIGSVEVIQPLINELDHSDPAVREHIIATFHQLGQPALDALVDELNETLESRDITGFAYLIQAIRDIEGLHAISKEMWFEVLATNNPRIRMGSHNAVVAMAIQALCQIGSVEVIRPLINELDYSDPVVHEHIIATFRKLGQPALDALVDALNETLESRDVTGFAYLIQAIRDVEGLYAVSKETWLGLLTDTDSRVRYEAVSVLGEIQEVSAVPHLYRLLSDPNETVRTKAVEVLMVMDLPVLTETLLNNLVSENLELRRLAALHLSELRNPAILPTIDILLTGEDVELRRLAVDILDQLECNECIPYLVKALTDNDAKVRQQAAKALNALSWEPETPEMRVTFAIAAQDWDECVRLGLMAVDQLQFHLYDMNPWIRAQAAQTLGNLNSVQSVSELTSVAHQDDQIRVRVAAVGALTQISSSEVVTSLKQILKSEDKRLQRSIIEMLPQMSETLVESLTYEMLTIEDKNTRVLEELATSLEKVDNHAALITQWAVEDTDPIVRKNAVVLLAHFADVPTLAELFKHDSDDEVQKNAGDALGKIGSKKAVRVLVEALADPDLKQNAAQVLKATEQPALVIEEIRKNSEVMIEDDISNTIIRFLQKKYNLES